MTIDRVAVVGAGVMGHGIAVAYAASGRAVSVFDVDPDQLATAQAAAESAIETLAEAGRIEAGGAAATVERLSFTDSMPEALAGADLVTEAVPEEMDLKRSVFEDLDEHAPADAVLATNTSGLSITEIAGVVEEPARVVGTHWFNPPYVVPLVEVVRGEATADEVVAETYDLLAAIGKTPVEVERSIPGFIGNRIQMAMAYEAYSLLERGVASAEEIDKAVKAGFGFRLPTMGVFEKVDQSGLDVHHEVESNLMPDLDRGTDPNPVVSRLVEEGHHGLKTGRGVYDWRDADAEDVYERRDAELLELLDAYEAALAGRDEEHPHLGE